ncbi:MAG: chloride channel protein [Planctomycetaceae bacterium]|nr:chloride channel protein [Planctomycetaceae bacterium]
MIAAEPKTRRRYFRLRNSGKWFLLSLVVGIAAGLGGIVFQVAGQVVVHYVLQPYSGFSPGEAKSEHSIFGRHEETDVSIPWLVGILTVGGLASGLLVYTFAPEAEGHGTDGAIDAFHNRRGNISGVVAVVKTIASAITLGTAGSGGREGPIAQIGAATASVMGRMLKLSARDRRILLAAGMGAGVGAIFRAPLAGALFAGEILYRDADLESDVIVPAAIASIVSYSVYGLFLPAELCFQHVFGDLSEYTTHSLSELLPYAVLALVLSVVAVSYIKCFYGIHALFAKLPGPRHIRPAIGAALAGLVAAALYYGFDQNKQVLAVLSTGYGTLQQGLKTPQDVTITVLLVVGVFKILTTSLTISSGGSGGVFGPSMVIGGCTGVAVGKTINLLAPQMQVSPGAFGIVGMAGFFAGCAHAPISTIIMVSEMTGSYQLLLPTMWVSTLCFVLCQKWSLYQKQVPTRLDSPAHRGDFLVDILEGITVDDCYRKDRKVESIPEAMTLAEIVQLVSRTHQHYFPVVNADGKMVGIFSTDDVRRFAYDETIWNLADAADVMVTEFLSVTPRDDLNVALQKFTALNLDELPVLDPADDGKLLGMLRRKETIAIYNRRLLESKKAAERETV